VSIRYGAINRGAVDVKWQSAAKGKIPEFFGDFFPTHIILIERKKISSNLRKSLSISML
jgi:hypothetical protein